MPFKDISYLEPGSLSVCQSGTIYTILVEGIMKQFCEIILNLGQWFWRRCLLKDFLSGALAALLFSGEKHLCIFERGHHGKHSCEVILNLD